MYIVFDEKIILGARASKISESKLDAFSTINALGIGEIKVNLELQDSCYQMKPGKLKVNTGFESDIIIYQITPGCDPADLTFLLKERKYKGIIIRGYGTGNIPCNFKNFFSNAEKDSFPVVVSTQCLHGMTSIGTYESGNWFTKYNIFIDGFDQSIETLTVKLQHALRISNNIEEMKNIIQKNYCGEINKKYIKS